MTVKELKELLADKPDDAQVQVGFFASGFDTPGNGWHYEDARDVFLTDETGPTRQVVTIR